MNYLISSTTENCNVSRNQLVNFLLDHCIELHGQEKSTAKVMVMMEALQNGSIKITQGDQKLTITGEQSCA